MKSKRRVKRKLKPGVKALLGFIGVLFIVIVFNKLNNIINGNIDIFSGNKKIVVIDIGHGGNDQGTQSLDKQKMEKDITLQIGSKVIEKLEKDKSIKVIATRTTDEYISLKERNKIEAENNADLFVSIHANATGDSSSSTEGVETFYWKNDDMSYKLAKSIHNNIISSVGAVDRGIKRGNYQVLRDSSCPSVLIETRFLTNYKESVNLSKNSYQNKLANAIVKGIQEYISEESNISE